MTGNKFTGSGTELVNGTLRGYRCWRLVRYIPREVPRSLPESVWGWRPEFVLAAVSWPVFWGGAEITEARCGWKNHTPCMCSDCRERYESIHRVPMQGCTCGVYAWYTPDWARHEHTSTVIGVIEAHGKILLGTSGFRAQRARIVAIAPMNRRNVQARNALRVMTSRRYSGVKVAPDPDALFREYPPDLGTVTNLGVTMAPAPSSFTEDSIARQLWNLVNWSTGPDQISSSSRLVEL